MQPGQRIGRYVLANRIAVGGMAEVWAARVEGPRGFVKPLALKFILESFAGDPELEKMFVNEARIAARLQHANIVTVFDFDKVGAEHENGLAGRYYIAMERVEGHDLRRIATAAHRAGRPFPQPLALYIAGEALKGLRYVHERRDRGRPMGLVHRDVSPHNVLVSYGGEVKLSDFGIAKARQHSGARTKTGNVRGKLSYASPEQLNAEPVDHRTDQFALGVTLWELLAGRRLFDGSDEMEIIGKVLRCEIPSLGGLDGSRRVSPGLEAVVHKMLSARREDRYRTTAEALSAVVKLRDYGADGVTLGELLRALIPPTPEFPSSFSLEAAPAATTGALADTKTLEPAAPRPPGGAPAVSPPRTGRTPVTKQARGQIAAAVAAGKGDSGDLKIPHRRGALIVGAAALAAAVLAIVLLSRPTPPKRAAAPAPASVASAPQAAGGSRELPMIGDASTVPALPDGTKTALVDQKRGSQDPRASGSEPSSDPHGEIARPPTVPLPALPGAPAPLLAPGAGTPLPPASVPAPPASASTVPPPAHTPPLPVRRPRQPSANGAPILE